MCDVASVICMCDVKATIYKIQRDVRIIQLESAHQLDKKKEFSEFF